MRPRAGQGFGNIANHSIVGGSRVKNQRKVRAAAWVGPFRIDTAVEEAAGEGGEVWAVENSCFERIRSGELGGRSSVGFVGLFYERR